MINDRLRNFSLSSGILILFTFLTLAGCSESATTEEGDRIVGNDFAYQSWPNESTTSPESGEIRSKVLISDLDSNRTKENVFISVLPNSSNQRSSILRITQGADFLELANFRSTSVALYQEATPFSFDLDSDGNKELLFLSYDRDKVYSFELKNELKDVFIRWTANLPTPLDQSSGATFSPIVFRNKEMIKIGSFGLFEKPNRKVKVYDLASGGGDDDDDDDD